MLTLLAAASLAVETAPIDNLAWQWPASEARSWYVDSTVVMPAPLWFLADRNRDARVWAWHLRAVLVCDDVKFSGRRSWSVGCSIPESAIDAIAMPGDAGDGLLPPILAEIDQKLGAAEVHFTLRDDGRIGRVWVDGLPRRERRNAITNENVRHVLVRAIAGFDLRLPVGGGSPDGVWTQSDSWLFYMPAPSGTAGGTATVHRASATSSTEAEIETVGRGIVGAIPRDSDEPTDLYETRLEGLAVFDRDDGILRSRVWASKGTPTAGSRSSIGTAGLPYVQYGSLQLLDPGAPLPDFGPSREIVLGKDGDIDVDNAPTVFGAPALGEPHPVGQGALPTPGASQPG